MACPQGTAYMHDAELTDDKPYYDERGRLVKWTYADGCRRVSEKVIPEEYRRAFPAERLNDLKSAFLTVCPTTSSGIEGEVFCTPFVTEAPR